MPNATPDTLPGAAPAILTISELTRALRSQIEERFAYVWVRGQVTNVSRPASGHVYFSLRDDNASLACVWFKPRGAATRQDLFDPLTGEVFEDGPRQSLAERLDNGQEIICSGRMSVYAPRGSYQLVVEFGQEEGMGRLHAEFEALKARLAEQGYFDVARKRPLPRLPRRVAVITSPAAAALQDFLSTASQAGPGAEIRIYPALVQGEEAPPQIVRAIEQANADHWAQLIVLIRGGGSLEDLWAFNSPLVAEAVFHSGLPVLAGIGHEVDTSLADLTADVRAITPTHAGRLIWPERLELMQQVDEAALAAQRFFTNFLARREQALETGCRALAWFSPSRTLERGAERLGALHGRLLRAAQQWQREKQQRAEALSRRLDGAFGPEQITRRANGLDIATQRLHFANARRMDFFTAELERRGTALAALDPRLPLRRGYSMTFDAEGRLLRGVSQTKAGSAVTVLLADGSIAATVDGVSPNSAHPETETSTQG